MAGHHPVYLAFWASEPAKGRVGLCVGLVGLAGALEPLERVAAVEAERQDADPVAGAFLAHARVHVALELGPKEAPGFGVHIRLIVYRERRVAIQ